MATTHTHNALSESDAVDNEFMATDKSMENLLLNAEARVESLGWRVSALEKKVADRDRDLEELRVREENALTNADELRSSLSMMTEIADSASRDAARAGENACDLAHLLDESNKVVGKAYETLAGVRAFALSECLSDHEKVSLILRLIA